MYTSLSERSVRTIYRTITAATLVALAAAPVYALLGFDVVVCANCSDESTSVLMKIQQELGYAKQIEQYLVQAEQLADAIRQSTHGGPKSLNNIAGDLSSLATAVQGSQALAYSLSGQDAVFRRVFPGYQSSIYAPKPGVGTYQNNYSQWAQTSLATTQGILRGMGIQGKLLATEQGVLGVLRILTSSNLLNRDDAINLGGQLAAEQVGQLQKLRELQLEDMSSKAAFQGYQIQRDATGEQAGRWFFQGGEVTADGRTFQGGDLDP